MAVEETIAVVGLRSGRLTGFVETLARDKFQMLIVPEDKEQAARIAEDVETLDLGEKIEVLDCAKEGCWQADIIAFINPHGFTSELIDHVKEVAVQKVVIAVFEGISPFIANERFQALEKALPHSKLVRLVVIPDETKVSMWGEDKEAVQKVAGLLEKSPYTISQ